MKITLTVQMQLEVLQTLAEPADQTFEQSIARLYSEKKWEELSKPLLDHCVSHFIKLEKGASVKARDFIDKHNTRDCIRPIMFNEAEKEHFVFALRQRLLDINLIDTVTQLFVDEHYSTNPTWTRN